MSNLILMFRTLRESFGGDLLYLIGFVRCISLDTYTWLGATLNLAGLWRRQLEVSQSKRMILMSNGITFGQGLVGTLAITLYACAHNLCFHDWRKVT